MSPGARCRCSIPRFHGDNYLGILVDESTEWLLKIKGNDEGPNRNNGWNLEGLDCTGRLSMLLRQETHGGAGLLVVYKG